jgi:SAM-dependent MidA family methyltransferase
MQRDLAEIVESQHRMLVENKKLKDGVYAAQIENTYEKYLSQLDAWEKRNKNVEVLRVNYADALSNPKTIAQKIEQFLGIEIDYGLMTEVMDLNLYRTKKQR